MKWRAVAIATVYMKGSQLNAFVFTLTGKGEKDFPRISVRTPASLAHLLNNTSSIFFYSPLIPKVCVCVCVKAVMFLLSMNSSSHLCERRTAPGTAALCERLCCVESCFVLGAELLNRAVGDRHRWWGSGCTALPSCTKTSVMCGFVWLLSFYLWFWAVKNKRVELMVIFFFLLFF